MLAAFVHGDNDGRVYGEGGLLFVRAVLREGCDNGDWDRLRGQQRRREPPAAPAPGTEAEPAAAPEVPAAPAAAPASTAEASSPAPPAATTQAAAFTEAAASSSSAPASCEWLSGAALAPQEARRRSGSPRRRADGILCYNLCFCYTRR